MPERAWAGDRYLVFANSTPLTDRVYQERSEVYLRDLMFGELQAVTTRGDGPSWDPSISECGRFVVFLSEATDLDRTVTTEHGHTNAYLWERLAKRFHCLTPTADGPTHEVTISGDGSTIALSTSARLLPGDTNQRRDIYLRDRLSGELTWISAQETEDAVSPTLNSDGSLAAYVSKLYGSWQVYGWSRSESRSAVLSRSAQNVAGNGDSFSPSLSDLGLVFSSRATNLLPNTGPEPENLFGISGSLMALLVENASSPVVGRASLDLAFLQNGRLKLLRPEVSLTPEDLGQAEAVAISRRRPLWQDLDALHACDPDRGQPRRMNSPYQPSAEISGFPVQELGLSSYGRILYQDLNGDDLPDVVGMVSDEAGPRRLLVALAQADGSFVASTFSVGGFIEGFDGGFLNGDKLYDLVVAVNVGTFDVPQRVLQVYHGQGDGTFTLASSMSINRDDPMPIVGNFLGNGFQDVLLFSRTFNTAGAAPQIFAGNGNGELAAGPTLPFLTHPGPPAILDINNDGIHDVVVLDDATGDVIWMINDGQGGVQGEVQRLPLVQPGEFAYRQLQVVDVDGDGLEDLLIDLTAESGENPLLQSLMNQAGTLVPGATLPTYVGRPYYREEQFIRADVTGDGNDELISQSFIIRPLVEVLSRWNDTVQYALGLGDVNGSGILDILQLAGTDLIWALNNGDGTFGPRSLTDLDYAEVISEQVADFNGDLLMDLLGFQHLLLGTPERSFVSSAHSLSMTYQARIEDFNGDGLPDVLWASKDGLHVALNLGGGHFELLPVIPLERIWGLPKRLADIDQDGHIDILLATYGTSGVGSYQVWRGLGDGTFELSQSIPVQNRSNVLELVDLNENGFLDVWNGEITMLSSGPGVFDAPIDHLASYSIHGATLGWFADITGVGKQEALISPGSYTEVSDWDPPPDPSPWLNFPMEAYSFAGGSPALLAPFEGPIRVGMANSVRSLIFEDANGNGHLDVLMLVGTGNLVRAFGDGTGRFVEDPAVHSYTGSSGLHRFDYDYNGTFDTLVTGTRVYFLDR